MEFDCTFPDQCLSSSLENTENTAIFHPKSKNLMKSDLKLLRKYSKNFSRSFF